MVGAVRETATEGEKQREIEREVQGRHCNASKERNHQQQEWKRVVVVVGRRACALDSSDWSTNSST